MKLFTNNTFIGHYPVGTAAMVLAHNPEHAALVLEEALSQAGLAQKIEPSSMTMHKVNKPLVIILQDGNY